MLSCETQLVQFLHDLVNNCHAGDHTELLVMDFSEAFDIVGHMRLLRKIASYGIRGCTLNWIKSFLAKHIQVVVVDGERSWPMQITSGVPQGSVCVCFSSTSMTLARTLTPLYCRRHHSIPLHWQPGRCNVSPTQPWHTCWLGEMLADGVPPWEMPGTQGQQKDQILHYLSWLCTTWTHTWGSGQCQISWCYNIRQPQVGFPYHISPTKLTLHQLPWSATLECLPSLSKQLHIKHSWDPM